MKIWTVDAFATKPFTGNPAGVLIVDQFPADEICQNIAAELNLSETAFVKPLNNGDFHLRWFTPKVEVKLCGHATLSAAHILFQENKVNEDKITFQSLSGPLSVYRNSAGLTLDFPLQNTQIISSTRIYQDCFGEALVAVAQAYDDILVELNSASSVYNLDLPIEKIEQIDCRGLIVTALSNQTYDFVSRFFAPRVGVPEDPVTGSAHCKLAHYWLSKTGKKKFFAYQASKRGGELQLEVQGERVLITGQALTMLKAEVDASLWLIL